MRLDEPDEDQPVQQKGAGVARLRAAWGRRKWLALLAFALPASASVALIIGLPEIYKSAATVLVERQQVPEAFVRPTVTSELETRLHTISQEILSRSRLESLISRFGLYADLRRQRSSEEVVERMRHDIQLELKSSENKAKGRAGATTAFTLSYRGRDPQTVALVTNTLASFYIEENLRARERQATGTAEFLKAQLNTAKQRLDEQEARVSEFRRRYVGELPQQMQANLATLEALTTQLRINNDNQIRAMERREALRTQLAETAALAEALPVATGEPAGLEPGAVRLIRLRLEMTAARARFTDDHPTIGRLRDEIAAVEQELSPAKSEPSGQGEPGNAAAARARPPSPYALRLREALQGAEAELKILKVEEQRLRGSIGGYQTRVENTPKREQEFQDLSRDHETTKEHYQSLVKRHDEAQLAESMEQRQKGEQFRIIDSAIPATSPAAPNRGRLLALSLAFAASLGVGALVLAEMLDTSFHSVAELRAFTTVPVLASIARISTEADHQARGRRVRRLAALAVVGLVLVAGASYFTARGNEPLVQLLARDRS